MKKFAVIAAMALSMAAMTACGSSSKEKTDNASDIAKENQGAETTEDGNTDESTADIDNDKTDTAQPEENTEAEDGETQKQDTDNGSAETDSGEDVSGQKTELLEAGEEPDFKLNENGCFNGKYEGNDGCTYKFTKKGKLVVTSDAETMKYQYTINGDVLNMVAEDGSFGTSRQITLLEDGTYLLDDTMGNQVVLTYAG